MDILNVKLAAYLQKGCSVARNYNLTDQSSTQKRSTIGRLFQIGIKFAMPIFPFRCEYFFLFHQLDDAILECIKTT